MIQFEELLSTGTPAAPVAAPDTTATKIDTTLRNLGDLSVDDLLSRMVNGMVEFAIHLCIAVIVFYVGRFIINKLYKVVEAIFIRRQIDHSLTTFILSLIRIVLYFILIVTVIGILGIETSSFLALFASAGVAVGLALSGTLQNFAGGVLILLLKPYRIGDYIEAQGYAGTVKEIQVFSTILTTPDNKSIIIPNGGLSTGSINNYSREDYRRVDWTVSISYGDSIDTAREAILQMLADDHRIVRRYIEDDRRKELTPDEVAEADRAEAAAKKVEADRFAAEQRREERRNNSWWRRITGRKAKVRTLGEVLEERHRQALAMLPKADCSPVVYVGALADSSVNLTVRAWTKSSLYWSVFFDMNERFYRELPDHGINFPFPQMDVHISRPD